MLPGGAGWKPGASRCHLAFGGCSDASERGRLSEAWDLFPAEALGFPGERLSSLAARLAQRGALPPGGIGRRGINPPSQGQRSIIQREMASGETCE